VLDKPDQVGYDERQASYDGRTSSSACLFACDATALKMIVTTWWATLQRAIPHWIYYRG